MHHRMLVPIAALVLVSCSGGSGTPGDPTASPTPGAAGGLLVTCGDIDTVVLDGALDGASVSGTHPRGSFSWVNLGNPSRFDASWPAGKVHLEWPRTIPNNVVTDLTTATLTIDGNTKPRTFQSGRLVYDSPRGSDEDTLKTELNFDTGRVTVCIRKK